jgi:hypothetical protein
MPLLMTPVALEILMLRIRLRVYLDPRLERLPGVMLCRQSASISLTLPIRLVTIVIRTIMLYSVLKTLR